MNNLTKDFPQRVYEYRVKNNMTQEEFGEIIGLTRSNVSSLENGRLKPSKRVVTKFEMLTEGE